MARGFSRPSVVAAKKEEDQSKWSAWIEVNLDALEHNLKQIREHSLAPILPILKGDAYGHGAPVVAAFLQSKGCRLLGVSSIEEAVAILEVTKATLLVLTPPLLPQIPLIFQYGLIPTVTSAPIIRELGAFAERRREKITVHLKVDTGFGRLGVTPEEAPNLVALIKKTPYLELGGVFTHFPAAFSDPKFTQKQLRTLLVLREHLTALGWKELTWHAANSAALLTLPASHLDLVRVGTLLYGQSPLPLDSSWDLAETWRFKTRLVQIRTLPQGHTIGYGRTFRTKKETRVGVIPVGYAHGLELEPQSTPWRQIKQALGKTWKGSNLIFHANSPLPILGRIGMGLTCVDLSAVPNLTVGDEVSIAMRRVTSSGHVPRVYYQNGQVKCVFWNQKIISNSRDPFARETPLGHGC